MHWLFIPMLIGHFSPMVIGDYRPMVTQYRSSHKIRFRAASSLASKGASVQDLMSIGGWSNTETAMRYIRMNSVGKRNKQLFNEAVR